MRRDALQKASHYFVLLLLLAAGPASRAQESTASPGSPQEASLKDSVRQLQVQIQELQAAVREIRSESERYRAETVELKQQLQVTLDKLNTVGRMPAPGAREAAPAVAASAGADSAASQTINDRVAKLEEDQQLLEGKVDEQSQTRIETASKYHMRLSGIVLMDLFSNTGNVDHIENPSVALATNPTGTGANTGGSFGATLRQSQLALEIFGPSVAGAKTSANFVADFFSESPETVNGTSSGFLRLRTGTLRMDWQNTSIITGVDGLAFSPKYPTSYASLGIPAFSYTGNLYGWLPQLVVEHRFKASQNSTITLSGGIVDPFTGESPFNEFLRLPGAGESSRQPGYESRIELSRRLWGQRFTVGAGGYYSRENWGFDRNIDGWAATTDWNLPLGTHLAVSGKLYAGRAIGGLGAGIGRSVIFNGSLSDQTTVVQALRSRGGWTQLKFMPASKLEFNVAAGHDGVPAADVRALPLPFGTPIPLDAGYFAGNLTRNESQLANVIYRPRSDLVFSTEYRRLQTVAVDGTSQRANQLSLIMGVLF
jgi:hypothetical protein